MITLAFVRILVGLQLAHAQYNVDEFNCQFKFTLFPEMHEFVQNQKMTLVRKPFASPFANVEMTRAENLPQFQVQGQEGTIQAMGRFEYYHATRKDSQGNIIQAAQRTCFSIRATWCADGQTNCSVSPYPCQLSDPFGAILQWGPVDFTNDLAAFDTLMPMPFTTYVSDANGKLKGEVRASCDLL